MSLTDKNVRGDQQAANLHEASLSAARSSSTQGSSADEDTAAFTFVGTLAADVSSGEFDLPSWPEVVVQIRRALEDEEFSVDHIVRLIGSEPVLAARILKMAILR